MLATQYAQYYEINPQRDGENDMAFRNRVANRLRAVGKLIEAHEAYQNSRWDTDDNVVTGLVGAIAKAAQGREYGGDAIGNDIAAGHIVQAGEPDTSPELALLAALLFK